MEDAIDDDEQMVGSPMVEPESAWDDSFVKEGRRGKKSTLQFVCSFLVWVFYGLADIYNSSCSGNSLTFCSEEGANVKQRLNGSTQMHNCKEKAELQSAHTI